LAKLKEAETLSKVQKLLIDSQTQLDNAKKESEELAISMDQLKLQLEEKKKHAENLNINIRRQMKVADVIKNAVYDHRTHLPNDDGYLMPHENYYGKERGQTWNDDHVTFDKTDIWFDDDDDMTVLIDGADRDTSSKKQGETEPNAKTIHIAELKALCTEKELEIGRLEQEYKTMKDKYKALELYAENKEAEVSQLNEKVANLGGVVQNELADNGQDELSKVLQLKETEIQKLHADISEKEKCVIAAQKVFKFNFRMQVRLKPIMIYY
jgi:hypothetical protein